MPFSFPHIFDDLPTGNNTAADLDDNFNFVIAQIQASANMWAIAAGTSDAITAAYSPTLTGLSDGMCLGFRATAANLTTTPSFNPDGQGAYTITKRGGAALAVGDIPGAGAEVFVRLNLAATRWELLNPSIIQVGTVPWAIAGGTADAITATYSPPNLALSDGLLLGFRASAANATITPNFAPDGLAPHTITKAGGVALTAGNVPGNLAECLVRYNLANTRWELLNPATLQTGAATTFLGSDVLLNNAALFFTGPNTGSIGGAGQVWQIIAVACIADYVATARFSMIISLNGTTNLLEISNTSYSTGLEVILTATIIVTLTTASTFSLLARDQSSGSGVLKTSATGDTVANTATSITAVRLS